MKRLTNLKKTPIEVAQILSSSEQIQKLLIVDNEDIEGTSFTPKTFNQLMKDKYITFAPLEDAIKNLTTTLGRNTFIIIVPQNTNFVNLSGCIYIGTNESHLMLTKNRFRLLELADEIAQKLDGRKLTAAGTINITSMDYTIYSEFTFGYKIYFTIRDLNNDMEEGI